MTPDEVRDRLSSISEPDQPDFWPCFELALEIVLQQSPVSPLDISEEQLAQALDAAERIQSLCFSFEEKTMRILKDAIEEECKKEEDSWSRVVVYWCTGLQILILLYCALTTWMKGWLANGN